MWNSINLNRNCLLQNMHVTIWIKLIGNSKFSYTIPIGYAQDLVYPHSYHRKYPQENMKMIYHLIKSFTKDILVALWGQNGES